MLQKDLNKDYNMQIKYFLIIILFLNTLLLADNSYYLLGSKSQNRDYIYETDSIIWNNQKQWSVSQPQNRIHIQKLKTHKMGYILINNDTINYKTDIKEDNIYKISQGWNYFATPKDGIDVIRSFQKKDTILFVYTYDKRSHAWAGYSPSKILQKKIASTRILALKYIEPKRGFYIFSLKDITLKTSGTTLNKRCKKIVDKGYNLLIASGIDKKNIFNKDKTLSIRSRYSAHYRRGVYNDSRVALIFNKNKKQRISKKLLSYGPIEPAVIVQYDKKWEDSWFFIFDYFTKECYRGMFPSKKVPPFSNLPKLK